MKLERVSSRLTASHQLLKTYGKRICHGQSQSHCVLMYKNKMGERSLKTSFREASKASLRDLAMVYLERNRFRRRAHPRYPELCSRQGIKSRPGPLRLQTKSNNFCLSERLAVCLLEFDLFATWLTNQLSRFVSWITDTEAYATDDFFEVWSRGYA